MNDFSIKEKTLIYFRLVLIKQKDKDAQQGIFS